MKFTLPAQNPREERVKGSMTLKHFFLYPPNVIMFDMCNLVVQGVGVVSFLELVVGVVVVVVNSFERLQFRLTTFVFIVAALLVAPWITAMETILWLVRGGQCTQSRLFLSNQAEYDFSLYTKHACSAQVNDHEIEFSSFLLFLLFVFDGRPLSHP